jgi:hypothetical protein
MLMLMLILLLHYSCASFSSPQPIQRSWEDIVEDESGGIKSTQLQDQKERKKRSVATAAQNGGKNMVFSI